MNSRDQTIFDWAGTDAQAVADSLVTDAEKGLSTAEAGRRLATFGPNAINVQKEIGLLRDVLTHMNSPLVIILIVATGVSYALGETLNATIIFVMIFLSVAIDMYLERDARNAAEKLKEMVRSQVTVLRDGREQTLSPEMLVPGDVILLNAGKIIPADARVYTSRDFFVNQSSLTGESFPCEKHPDACKTADEELTALNNILFMGSSVISGTAKAIVVKTGDDTQFGKIALQLVAVEETTDFSRGMRDFGYLIMRVTIGLVLFIFLVNAILKHDLLESFMFSIAIAVGLTPELLPMIMTVTMARGSIKMARKGVIVKKLTAIPNFGSMEVLCTDKTGTLTQDRIHLVKCLDPQGNDSPAVFLDAYLNSHFQTGIQNPLDDAILNYSTPDISAFRKMDEVPFDFNRRRLSIIVQDGSGATRLICKGAPEEILKVCRSEGYDDTLARQCYDALSADGYRVLAIASRIVAEPKNRYAKDDEQDLTLNGFVAFLDPAKDDADEVVKELAAIGVEVKIITGDNHLVTRKICSDIGLPVKGILQGHEMDQLSDDALRIKVRNTTIFARFSPEQKNRVILAIKAYCRSVGYMGDGINDAPSLRAADIGISVNTAVDVAKDAADIILTRKSLRVLRAGILEGRRTFSNTMKYILMGLSSNFGNMFSVAAATLFLPFLPMLPIQILINNFLYDLSQVTIPYDDVDPGQIRHPQRWDMHRIRRFMVVFGLTSSVFDLLTFLLLYHVFAVSEVHFRTGWFMESLATQTLVIFIIRTYRTPFLESRPAKPLVVSMLVCVGIGWLLPWLPFASVIGFAPLESHVLLAIAGLVLVYLLMAEMMKRLFFKQETRVKHTPLEETA